MNDGQWIEGNANIQVGSVGDSATVTITVNGNRLTTPIEPSIVVPPPHVTSPSRLIRARSGVVPFVEIGSEFADLERWLNSPAPVSMHAIVGAGGSGKTRLGVQLANEASVRHGWLAGLLQRGAGEVALEGIASAPTARLVVIDYAEYRVQQTADLMLRATNVATDSAPVRVLLLARGNDYSGDDFVRRFRGYSDWFDVVLDNMGETRLTRHSLSESTDRERLFTASAQALAERIGSLTDATSFEMARLQESVYDTPLMIVIAAYLHVAGSSSSDAREQLLRGALEHELSYWKSSATDSHLQASGVVLSRVAAGATLVGANSETAAHAVVVGIPDLADASAEKARELARWYASQYPGPHWWNPIEPDLLGEQLVADNFEHLRSALLSALSSEEIADSRQPLELLARAVRDHEGLSVELSTTLQLRLPGLVASITASFESASSLESLSTSTSVAASLSDLVVRVPLGLECLQLAEEALPRRRDLVLGALALVLTERLVAQRARVAVEDPEQEYDYANSLNNYSNRLSDMGSGAAALQAIRISFTLLRREVESDDPDRRVSFATSAVNLSNRLSDVGEPDEALATVKQAVVVLQAGREDGDAAWSKAFAVAMHAYADRLHAAGKPIAAINASRFALMLVEELMTTTPSAEFANAVVGSRQNLASRLEDNGQRSQALAEAGRAVATARAFAKMSPATHLAVFGTCLSTYSRLLLRSGRARAALGSVLESIMCFREVLTANPSAGSAKLSLAKALAISGDVYAGLNREADAKIARGDCLTVLLQCQPSPDRDALLVSVGKHSAVPGGGGSSSAISS